jgi:hypothetical protein
MRRLWAAGAVIVTYLAIGVLPAGGQEPTDGATTNPAPASKVTHVTGTVVNSVGTFTPPGSVGEATVSDPRLGGCYVLQDASWGAATSSWGTFTVFDKCAYGVWPTTGSTATWTGGWFVAGRQPGSVSLYGGDLGGVWLDGLAGNEGWSASLRIEDGILDAWVFPTPATEITRQFLADGE